MSRVLLFLHGGSYTKECWNPIIRRLQQSPLLQRMPCEIATFDWRFHGEKSDHSIPATVSYRDGDETKARVDHPLREWTKWGADDVRHQVQNLRALNSTMDIVAIGHSMGATTMLQVEIETPETFRGIIAFEPVHKQKNQTDADRAAIVEILVSVASSRVSSWNSWADVEEHFKTSKAYRRWDPECMEAFLEQGIRRTSAGTYVLATTPLQEAALYSHTQLDLDFARVACPVAIEHAPKSFFFSPRDTNEIAQRNPDKYTIADSIPNTTHSLVVEDPGTCADHILTNLSRLPMFQESHPAHRL